MQLQVALLIHTGLIGLLALLVLLVCSTAKMSIQRPMVSLGVRAEAEFAWSSLKAWSSRVSEAQFVITGSATHLIGSATHTIDTPRNIKRRASGIRDRCM